jgi:hypothetical protein
MKDHAINAFKGIPNFSYISFDRAYQLAENFLKIGGSGTMKDLCEMFGLKYKTGWLGLEIKSLRVWGLISGKGKMSLSERFYKIAESKDPNEKLLIKGIAFLEIPLFRIIFDRYSKIGLPSKKELCKILESEYKISQRYSSYISHAILDSISKYFKEYGKNVVNSLEIKIGKERETNLDEFTQKKDFVNIKINSPLGNFNLEATNKDEFEKIIKIINALWDKGSDTDENQDKGAHKT